MLERDIVSLEGGFVGEIFSTGLRSISPTLRQVTGGSHAKILHLELVLRKYVIALNLAF